MGAVGEDGVTVINARIADAARVPDADLAAIAERERAEVTRRAQRFRGGRQRVPLAGRVAVIVDDGIATGSTARAACQVARALGAARVVLAVPVAPPGWQSRIGHDADELVAVDTPAQFYAIGQFYADFAQTSDAEVIACLERADPAVEVTAGTARLPGTLHLPEQAAGVVLFAHGSGSSRYSPRNRFVASVLGEAGLGTLLFDLLTAGEEADRANVFDTGLLARRLSAATGWLRSRAGAAGLPVGYFGASTGAAAALLAAAEPGADVAAVVSRGGRPDLAGAALGSVRAPTLLIVGGDDLAVLDLNRRAQAALRCENELAVVPGAGHLFDEPGTLAEAAALARGWFTGHMTASLHPGR
jgi:putative phosphoribosyl transferase